MATTDRDAATELAHRIKANLIDPSKADQADRPASDRPPGFADALMSEKPQSVERAAKLSPADWELIGRALQHYATCGQGAPAGS
jgi:hypothetical protein